MPTLKGSKTEKNILGAFAGESQARNRYILFSRKARDEGYQQVRAAFEETAAQEEAHARVLFRLLEGGDIEITASFPAGKVGSTVENLKAAAAGENHEHKEMYPSFAAVADKEGFSGVAAIFRSIAVAERQHEKRYAAMAASIESGRVFKRDGKTAWRCLNCGFVHQGAEPPAKCPACSHPQGWFELLAENW